MSNLESPVANSSQGFGGIENGESSDAAAAQFSIPNARLELLEESLEELSSFDSSLFEDITSKNDLAALIDFASARPPESTGNDLKRKAAISNHKGVHFRQKNKKFVSRLCLPGGKSRKLELGEYNTHDEAARAYQVGAFYYNKSSTSNCGEDNSFSETLPCVPDNLSAAGKLAWVRERARHSAASIGTTETHRIFTSKRALESGGSSFDARPSTPASYGTHHYHSTPTTPTTSGSANPDNSFWGSGVKGPRAAMLEEMGEDRVNSLRRFSSSAIVIGRKATPAHPHSTTESKMRRCFPTRSQGSPNVELQQGRNSNALNNQTPVVDHQAVSQVKMTDSTLFALFELRKQGWEWTLKLRSRSSVEAGVLFSVPKGQHAAPELRITDIITNSFRELREQGWEVHLQPHGGGDVELRSELCVAPTRCAAQDKVKASKFSAWSLVIGTWRRASGHFGVQLVVKFSYAKQKLVWEVLESGQERKMEIHWSDIDGMKATCSDITFETLQIFVRRVVVIQIIVVMMLERYCELLGEVFLSLTVAGVGFQVSHPPSFFQDMSPQPMAWSSWQACTDFTEGQASVSRFHVLRFPPGVLKEHYEKLVQCDPRLKAADIRGQACASVYGYGTTRLAEHLKPDSLTH